MNNFDRNKALEERYAPILDDILRRNCAAHLLRSRPAGWDKDVKEATDRIYEVNTGEGAVAQRVRRWKSTGNYYRDFTIRRIPRSCTETEWHKLKRGKCRWYFYAWECEPGNIGDWMFIDLDALRETYLLDWAQATLRKNLGNDPTHFYWIPANVLIYYYPGVVLEHNMNAAELFKRQRRQLPTKEVMKRFREKTHAFNSSWVKTPRIAILRSIAYDHNMCPICQRERPINARITCGESLCMNAYTIGV